MTLVVVSLTISLIYLAGAYWAPQNWKGSLALAGFSAVMVLLAVVLMAVPLLLQFGIGLLVALPRKGLVQVACPESHLVLLRAACEKRIPETPPSVPFHPQPTC